MYLHIVIYGLLLNFTLCEALFLWKEKAMFLCSKVCPAYCSNRRRRRDVGPSFLGYGKDETPPYWPDESSDYIPIPIPQSRPQHHYHWVYKPTEDPKPYTTIPPPTTTTKDPTFICVLCDTKCGVTTPKPQKGWEYGSWAPKQEKEWAYGTGPWASKFKF